MGLKEVDFNNYMERISTKSLRHDNSWRVLLNYIIIICKFQKTLAVRSKRIRDVCYAGILDDDLVESYKEVVNKSRHVDVSLHDKIDWLIDWCLTPTLAEIMSRLKTGMRFKVNKTMHVDVSLRDKIDWLIGWCLTSR